MARAYRGPYAASSTYSPSYATALVWGTGIDPIHGYHGEGPPLRMLGRQGAIGGSPVGGSGQYPGTRDYQEPGSHAGFDAPEELTWGYPARSYGADSFGMGADTSPSHVANATREYMDDRPAWGDETAGERVRRDASTMAPWGHTGAFVRAMRNGAHRFRVNPDGPITAEPSNSFPNETVSEGWQNKVTSFIADAEPSDPAQYEVQTSMRQRYGTRNNTRAQTRGTDDERSTISSRVQAMVEKVYSTGERSYDMFPYQIDQIERPFRYRTAGVGRADWMTTNEYSAVTPVQRTPPADPSMGNPEVGVDDYGYTGEDTMYYA